MSSSRQHKKVTTHPKKIKKSRRKLAVILAAFIGIIFCIWLGLAIWARLYEGPKVTFDPKGVAAENYGPQAHTSYLRDAAGDKLELLTVNKPGSKGIILYFFGRSGRTPPTVSGAATVQTVVSPAYPGFYTSTGKPSPQGMYDTVDTTMTYLLSHGYKQQDITVLAHSLGALAALYAAQKYPELHNIVLVNPLYTPKAVCSNSYGPLCVFISNYASPDSIAPLAKAKVRQYHAVHDQYISGSQSLALFNDIGSADKKFYVVPGSHAVFDVQKILQEQQP